MAKDGFLEYLRGIISDLVDSNGNFRVMPIGMTGRRNLSIDRIKLLQNIIVLVTKTSIVTKETKMYLLDRYISIRGVNERLRDNGKDIKFSNTQSKIQYDRNKLQKIFGSHVFVDILTGNKIETYEKTVAEQFIKYSDDGKLRDNIALNIPCDCISTELSDNKFKQFIEVILPYIKSQMQYIEDNLDIESCGYFNYLLSMPNLSGVDKERADLLKIYLDNSKID